MATDAARKLEAQRLEKRRLAERGYDEIDRGYDEIDRGYDEIDRGYDEIDRGYDEMDRGGILGFGTSAGSSHAAVDLFRRAVGLGGHLKVTFVAPIGAATSIPRPPHRTRGISPKATSATAQAQVAAVTEQIKQKKTAGVSQAASTPPKPSAT